MTASPDRQVRFEELTTLTRQLAGRLSVNAEAIAATMDRIALWHEQIARDASHPLSPGAAERATRERRFAEDERNAALAFRLTAGGASEDQTPSG